MTTIEGTGYPIVFKVADATEVNESELVTVDTHVRSLEGMQKEALVTLSPGGASWRLACDEGPYLNGKDMAPFPLGFFTAGMQFCFLSQFLQAARARSVDVEAAALEQNNFYTMEGSFLRGDARGGAKPATLHLGVTSSAPRETIAELARTAVASSPTQSLMRTVLHNTFALTLNGAHREVPNVTPSPSLIDIDPSTGFDDLAPGAPAFLPEIITKVKQGEAVHGVEGGAGSSLKSEQKRTLHIRGEARLVEGLRMETVVHCLKPIGSSFRFACDESEHLGGAGQAPPPLAYMSAGVGFCFMTQLGRYATIRKHPLESYRIAQRTSFPFHGSLADGTRTGAAGPVDTQVFLDASYDNEDDGAMLVDMGQQTCFLHAAMRGEYASTVTVELNGEPVPVS